MDMSVAVLVLVAGLVQSTQAATCGVANSYRIIGGTVSTSCQFPWMVFVYNKYYSSMCGGSIIDQTHILTAAHCVLNTDTATNITYTTPPTGIFVYSGTSLMNISNNFSGAIKRNVISIAFHEYYDPDLIINDVAVLTLSAPIVYDRCHTPVCLANGTKTPQMASGCKAMGWGRIIGYSTGPTSTNLLWVDMPIASDASCQNTYGPTFNGKNFCAGAVDKNICAGDSGGPLVCKESDGRYYQYGIMSATYNDCHVPNAIFTKVSSFLPWINGKILAG